MKCHQLVTMMIIHSDNENSFVVTTFKILNDIWYIDSRCSNHMSGNSDLFNQRTRTIVPKQISMGNDICYTTKSSGDVEIQMPNDVVKSLNNV